MSRHAAVSTQERNPRSAVVRSSLVAVLSLFPVLNIILGITIEALRPYGDNLPGWVFAWLNGALVVVTLAIAWFTKIMANPAVNAWLREHAAWLSPEDKPKPVPPADPELTDDYREATLRSHSPIYGDDGK